MNSSSPIQVWIKALTQPNQNAYLAIVDDPGASMGKGVLWVAIAGFLGGMFSGLMRWIFNFDIFAQFTRYLDDFNFGFQRAGGGFLGMIGSTFGGLFGAVIGAFIITGLVHLVARMLGGTGSFDKLFYGYAAFQAPVILINAVIGNIPVINCLTIFIAVYTLVLMVIATQAVHRFDAGKAAIAALAPLLIVFLFCCCVFGIIGAATGAIFSSGGGGGNFQFNWENLMP